MIYCGSGLERPVHNNIISSLIGAECSSAFAVGVDFELPLQSPFAAKVSRDALACGKKRTAMIDFVRVEC